MKRLKSFQAKRGVNAIARKSAEIVLDFDATDDPLHGSEERGYLTASSRSHGDGIGLSRSLLLPVGQPAGVIG